MYEILLPIHSLFRWLVLLSLIICIVRSYYGWFTKTVYTKKDYILRSVTATIGHIQLIIGLTLYFKSPVIKYFLSNFDEAVKYVDISFFGLYHITLMIIAILVQTIGSSLSKRRKTDETKFRTAAIYFTITLIIIFLAIPWPSSSYAPRPYFRSF